MKNWLRWIIINLELMKRWNWKVIIVCFFTAFIFWVFNSLNSDHTATIRMPLEIVFEEDNIIPLQSPPEQINVNVSGYGWNLLSKSLGVGMEPIFVEITEPTKSNYISPRSLLSLVTDRLKDMKVNFIAEDSIRFNYDTLITKKVILRVDSSDIKLKQNFRRITPISLNQDTVVLRGAATMIRDYVDTLVLHPELSEIDEDIEAQLELPLTVNRFVSINPRVVSLSFEVKEFFRKSQILSIKKFNFPPDTTIYLKPVPVFLDYTIREDFLGDQPDSLVAKVDYQMIDWKDSTIIPLVEIPATFEDTLMIPPRIKVDFKK